MSSICRALFGHPDLIGIARPFPIHNSKLRTQNSREAFYVWGLKMPVVLPDFTSGKLA